MLASLFFGLAHASDGKVITQLMLKELTDLPGKEAVVITVDFAPGAEDPVHRHDAHAFVYVLEGTIVMQLKGAPAVTLKPGQVFYEGPSDVHIVGKNASDARPAKILVVLVKNRGAEVVLPAN
jgi:quercetin dioxygenase-like cupin family protein